MLSQCENMNGRFIDVWVLKPLRDKAKGLASPSVPYIELLYICETSLYGSPSGLHKHGHFMPQSHWAHGESRCLHGAKIGPCRGSP